MTYEEAKARVAAIEAEEMEMSERQYRYGYIEDRQYGAKLFQEKMQLKRLFGI